jgi:type IV pilus assembly protein PilY1
MRKTCFVLACLIFLGMAASSQGATNNDYCVFPIFATNAVKPNVMIDMDLSGSMQFAAYIATDLKNYKTSTYDYGAYSCVPKTTYSDYAKQKYDTTKTYYGYFDVDKCYAYSSTNGRFEVNSTGTCTNKIGTSGSVSGNMLNWITTTRLDVVRKALTGGRTYDSNTLQSEGTEFNSSISGTCDSGYQKYFDDTTTGCRFSVASTTASSRKLTVANATGYTCAIGSLSSANIRVKVQDASTISGIVDEFYGKVVFEFMGYNTLSSSMLGKIYSGKAATLSTLKTQINTTAATQGTPTGNSLRAANNFFRQSQYFTSDVASNSSYISSGDGTIDPYYDYDAATGNNAIPCRRSFVLVVSDGQWSDGYVDPARSAYELRVNDLRSDLTGTQNVTVYTIYAYGDQDADSKTKGRQAMITTAIFGGFDFSDTDKIPYGFTGLPSDSRNVTYPLSSCNPSGTWNDQCAEWDKSKTGLPYNFFEADEGDTIVSSVSNALNDMLRRSSSGTAASVLASAEGSGANILQAFFFPKRMFDNVEIDWTGEMQNLWYYIDPHIGNSTIREDTARNNVLDVYSDDIIEYEFDTGLGKTMVRRYQTNSSAQKGTEDIPSPVDLDEAKNLWEAGIMLWARDLATSPRTIYTSVDGVNRISFSASEASTNGTLQTYLQAPGDPTTAQNIVNYVHGYDITGYRNRTVSTSYSGTTGTHVWKLGDIISSTPRLKASFPLNSYHLYPSEGYNDRTYYQYVNDVDAAGNATGNYKQRGMAFVGANDGMFHAFELGKLSFNNLSANEAARLETVDVPLGTERWAYVPKGALPYLKYLMNTDYCHMYYVNQPTVIIDASVSAGGSLTQDPNYTKTRSSWKTILIGGMGMGGACRDTTSTCSTTSDCVKTPISGVGYSSYFAFDITDPTNPTLLWEFSRDDLGFSTTGPAIVRIGDPAKNGKWFAVFANGPTGPVNTTYHQFMGSSDQNLKFFVLDLLAGPQAAVTVIDTGITNAFGASLANSSFDVDRGDPNASGATPYSDDVIYMGYTKKDGTTWTKGGVVRLMTRNDSNPTNWVVSTVIDNVGPVTTSLAKLQDRKNGKLWLYFGTGRYFYRLNDGLTIDDPDSQQAFYGIIEPCYMSSTNMMNLTCTTTRTVGDLQDQTGSSSTLAPTALGWYISFPAPDSGYKAHRVLAQPVASYNGVVYFLTSSPSTDVCSMGGYTYLWAVWYNNGGAPPVAALSGMVVTQLSTGQIATPILKTTSGGSALTVAGGKAMAVGQGVNIGGGFSLLGPPKPLRKILHMKER